MLFLRLKNNTILHVVLFMICCHATTRRYRYLYQICWNIGHPVVQQRQRALGKNSKLPVYESYNKLFHRILSTCLKLHIPANLQTYPSQPKHLLITLNILANEYFKSGRHSWVTFSTISTLTYPSQATYLLNNTAYLIILNIFTNEYFKSERKKPDC